MIGQSFTNRSPIVHSPINREFQKMLCKKNNYEQKQVNDLSSPQEGRFQPGVIKKSGEVKRRRGFGRPAEE